MNTTKLLKQIVQVLDERGIQLKNVNIDDVIPGEYSIEVNKEITIVDRKGSYYELYTEDASLDKTYYSSLTEALEVVADYLSRVKIGDVLISNSGLMEFKVVTYLDNDSYNLLDLKSDCLLYLKGVSLDRIYKTYVKDGSLHVK